MKKVIFISSMGGHLTELMQLKSIFKDYDYKLVTEKHKSTAGLKARYKSKIDYLLTGNKDHILRYIWVLPYNVIKSLILFLKFIIIKQDRGNITSVLFLYTKINI